MKTIFALLLTFAAFHGSAQIGVKAGVNFANVRNAAEINSDNAVGFHVGAFFAPKTSGKSVLGFRTELVFSRQGYDFQTQSTTGSVQLDYILLPQLMTINITKFVQLQAGFQMAYLITAKEETNDSASGTYGEIMDYYNRFDYGAAGGIEIHPFKGLFIGARYCISFGDMYQDPSSFSNGVPPFYAGVDAKNNVVQLSAGYQF